MRHLDIALTTNTLAAGGAERQRVLLAGALAARGHIVTLYCLQEFGPLRAELPDAVHLVRRGYRRGPRRGHDVLLTGTTNTETAFALVGTVRTQLRWLVAVHNPMGDGAPRLARFARIAIERADGIAALSRWHADQLQKRWGLTADHLLGNGIDPEVAAAVAWTRGADSFRFDIGFLGRLSTRHKGLDTLLEALAEPAAASLTLAVAGSGPDEPELRRLAARLDLGDRVRWLGHQRPEEFLPQIRALALLSRYEGQPMAALEARAAGVPVVASETAGLEVGDGVHFVRSRDLTEVAAALAAAATHPLSPSAPVRGVEQMANEHLDVFTSLVFRRPVSVLHVGNDPSGSGGIASVVRNHLSRRTPELRMRSTVSYCQNAPTTWQRHTPAFRATGELLIRRPAVVHVHLSQGGSLLREGALALLAAQRGPVVLTLHGSRLLDVGPVSRRLLRLLVARARVVHGYADVYRDRFDVPKGKWHQLPNDVDIPHDEPPAKEPVVLFAGEVGLRKGVDVLLDAWVQAAPPGWTLHIAGQLLPEIRPWLERVANRSDVEVLGPVDHDALLARLNRAAVFVLPSRAETLPMAVCEAMARGCAIVGSDVGAFGELLTVAGQIVLPAGDAIALAAALGTVLDSEDRRDIAGRSARTYALLGISSQRVGEHWAQLYQQLR